MAQSWSTLRPVQSPASNSHLVAALVTAWGVGALSAAVLAWFLISEKPLTNPFRGVTLLTHQDEQGKKEQKREEKTHDASNKQPLRRKVECPTMSPQEDQPRREVICEDAIKWLQRPGSIPHTAVIFTSLPDVAEVQEFAPTLDEWRSWFMLAAEHVLQSLPPQGLAVFYQTDIRLPGVGQVSKAQLVLQAAAKMSNTHLLWHKVAHFGSVDQPSPTSVQFSHLLCFRHSASPDETIGWDYGSTIPDVVNRGEKPWGLKNSARCMGSNATLAVLKWVTRRFPNVDTVVDPFCGAGTVLAVGNFLGLHAVGVDISPRRVRQASSLDGAILLAGREASKPEGQLSSTQGARNRKSG